MTSTMTSTAAGRTLQSTGALSQGDADAAGDDQGPAGLLWLHVRRVSADTQVTTLRKAAVVAFPPHAAAGVAAN